MSDLTLADKIAPKMVVKALKLAGQPCIIKASIRAAFDPTKINDKSKPSYPTRGIEEDFGADAIGQIFYGQKAVQIGDKKISVAGYGLDCVPEQGWELILKGKTYRIEGVGEVSTGLLIALFVLHCRR